LLRFAKPAPVRLLPLALISVTVSKPSVKVPSSAIVASEISCDFNERKVAKTTAAFGLGGGAGTTVG
jgi:hypothetical protein